MILRWLVIFLSVFSSGVALTQNDISINASLHPESRTISINQEIVYHNTSKESLNEIYLFDWANSFSKKTTPLGKRFAENYDSSFHFEKSEDRGRTDIESITNGNSKPLVWERGDAVDILKVNLDTPLAVGEKRKIIFHYTVKVPNDKFTRFGVNDLENYKLQYWYLSPAVYDGKWQIYSNKNVEDLYMLPTHFSIVFHVPKQYSITSELNLVSENFGISENSNPEKIITFEGDNRMQTELYILQNNDFETVETDKFSVVTNIHDSKVSDPIRALLIDRVINFLDEKIGPYPFDKMVVSEEHYRKNPVYGLNQLPNFISPFPDGFEYDMEQLKTITNNYLANTLPLHSRNDYWLQGALQIYFMMEYVERYYPKMKIIGTLSNWWVIKWAHAADLEFNDQYPILYLNMARNNLQQALTTPQDSLLKFNKNIANNYYGGSGLKYLNDYLGDSVLEKSIREFYLKYKLKPVSSSNFQEVISENSELPINWFFDDFVSLRTTIDFKISKVKKRGDSLEVTVKNLRKNTLPVSLYGKSKDSIVYKQWLPPVDSTMTVMIPAKNIRKLVLNYEGSIPEYNRRNNYKKIKGLFNRPLQFRLFQDVEDPNYNQLFFMPIFEYNLYDGISMGAKLYNKTVLPKGVYFKLEPQYGLRSKTLIGSGSISYTQRVDEGKLYAMRYGISGNYYSYDQGLFYRRFTPYLTFAFRKNDLRDNEKQFINLRNVNVNRDENPNDPRQDPNYSVFNAQYIYSNPNLINYFRGMVDYQISQKFGKLSATFEYRKLFLNNRQLNIRMFAGAFIFNDTRENDDYFSFALDRPSDYLFDYNYYGRSENSGLFSQQLIVAEGGFKSQLQPAFSNSWLATVNASTNIWRWIYAYGDVGLINNTGRGTNAVFDSGIRLTLVADYFELYFPLYSNLGWEPGLPNYDQKVRFIVTLSPKTLLSLFTRSWY